MEIPPRQHRCDVLAHVAQKWGGQVKVSGRERGLFGRGAGDKNPSPYYFGVRLYSVVLIWQFWTKYWTKVSIRGNQVPTNVTSQRDYKLVPLCVHAYQI